MTDDTRTAELGAVLEEARVLLCTDRWVHVPKAIRQLQGALIIISQCPGDSQYLRDCKQIAQNALAQNSLDGHDTTGGKFDCPNCDRLRQERSDALNVKTKEGLTCSEWILRTGKAERERDEALIAKMNAEAIRDAAIRERDKAMVKVMETELENWGKDERGEDDRGEDE